MRSMVRAAHEVQQLSTVYVVRCSSVQMLDHLLQLRVSVIAYLEFMFLTSVCMEYQLSILEIPGVLDILWTSSSKLALTG